MGDSKAAAIHQTGQQRAVRADGQTPKPPDAGMRHLDHYAARLPRWRYRIRQFLIPIVRAETPYLALLQEKLRTPMLDSYFAFTANLGTHTFFMVMLPIQFWCGYTELGRATVHLLALGVILSGIVKDLLCLPRPLSPPLQRITMSGSAALEYGFPSTHSTNAVSVAAYFLWMLHETKELDPKVKLAWQVACYVYALSIMFGRIYCGMHGFFDVVIGTTLGGLLTVLQVMYGSAFDGWICSSGIWNPLIVLLTVLLVVRTHPEPADDCPCFDDSVAFAGVLIGVEAATWHFSTTAFSIDDPAPGTTPYSLEKIGIVRTVIRILLGVLLVFIWRATTKPLLFRILPPIFRVVEKVGVDLPRRFFLKASQYTSVPTLRRDDNVIPSAADISGLISSVRQRRGRAVSVGPQSAADAYETIAYRHEQRRRESMSDGRRSISPPSLRIASNQNQPLLPQKTLSETPHLRSEPGLNAPLTPIASRSPSSSALFASDDCAVLTPLTPPETNSDYGNFAGGINAHVPPDEQDSKDEEKERQEIFMKLERLRVRYDVEVVTKLIVYSGIAWLAVEAGPITFELVGLGMGVRTPG